jgi:hypothetical protein
LKSLLFQSLSRLCREFHNDVAFLDSAGAARAKVGPSVRRIEHHNVKPVL